MRRPMSCKVRHYFVVDGSQVVAKCINCNRGCHISSCSSLLYRTDPKAKRVQVRICRECSDGSPHLFSDTPPRPVAKSGREYGRIYRTRA